MAPNIKRKTKIDKTLDNKYTITFTKQELIFLYNVVLSREYKIGDAVIGFTAIKKIEPFVVIDTNIPTDESPLTLSEKKN